MDSQPQAPKVAIPRLQDLNYNQKVVKRKHKTPQDKRRCAVACKNCQKRKVRCTGEQPRCQICTSQDLSCIYSQARRDRLREAANQNSQLVTFLKDLGVRSGNAERQNIEDFINSLENNTSITTPATVQRLLERVAERDPMSRRNPAAAAVSRFSALPPSDQCEAISMTASSSHVEPSQSSVGTYWGSKEQCTNYNQLQHSGSTFASTSRARDDSDVLSKTNISARKRTHSEVQTQLTDYESLYALLKTRPIEEIHHLIYMIRSGDDLQYALEQIRCGDLLCQFASSSQDRHGNGRVKLSNGLVEERFPAYPEAPSLAQGQASSRYISPRRRIDKYDHPNLHFRGILAEHQRYVCRRHLAR